MHKGQANVANIKAMLAKAKKANASGDKLLPGGGEGHYQQQ